MTRSNRPNNLMMRIGVMVGAGPMELRDFQQVSGDTSSRAGALAMAGVLTAASRRFLNLTLSDLHWLVDETDQGHLEWVMPDFAALAAFGLSDPQACESLWRKNFLSAEDPNYRLMISLGPLASDEAAPLLRDLIEMFGVLDPYDTAGIGAICLTVRADCFSQNWAWPQRVALSGADRWSVENTMGGMFDRGLATVVAAGERSDLSFAAVDRQISEITDCGFEIALTNGDEDWTPNGLFSALLSDSRI